jgi:hypothetical protein
MVKVFGRRQSPVARPGMGPANENLHRCGHRTIFIGTPEAAFPRGVLVGANGWHTGQKPSLRRRLSGLLRRGLVALLGHVGRPLQGVAWNERRKPP